MVFLRKSRFNPTSCRKAFTLIELLISIAIICILITIAAPSYNRISAVARRVQCMSNIKHLTRGWMTYTTEHDGWLVSARWWQGNPTNPEDSYEGDSYLNNVDEIKQIKSSKSWPYMGKIDIYHCPSPRDEYREEFIRSYDMTNMMNGEGETGQDPNHGGGGVFYTVTDIPDPDGTVAFLECYSGWTDAGWRGQKGWDPSNDNRYKWLHRVSGNHNGGDNLAFVDGHVECHEWKDNDTIPNFLPPSADFDWWIHDEGSVDWDWLGPRYKLQYIGYIRWKQWYPNYWKQL